MKTTEERLAAFEKLFDGIATLSEIGNVDQHTHVTVATLKMAKAGLREISAWKQDLEAERAD